MNRQALIFIALLLVIVLIGTYVMLVRIFPAPTRDTLNDLAANNVITTETPNLTMLHTASLFSPTLLADGGTIRAYEAASGNVRDIDLAGIKPTGLESPVVIEHLQRIWWSPDNKVVITLRESEEGPQWLLYDYIARVAQPLDSSTIDVSFSPDGQRFAYLLGSGTNSVLYTASIGGSGVERIATIPDARPLLWWSSQNTILVAERPTGFDQSTVWSVSLPQKNMTPLPNTLYGHDLLPSPDGSRILHSGAASRTNNMALYISSPEFQNRELLSASTIVQKCTWIDENTTILCAIPNNFRSTSSAPLPDAYHWGEIRTQDYFVVINTSTNRITTEITPNTLIDATDIITTSSRDQIIFTNRHDGLTYQLRVPEGF